MMFLRALPLIVLLAACATILPSPRAPAADLSLHVQPNAIASGPGVSIADALRRPGENLLVNGTLLVDPDATAWLCEALGESFPPSCGGARLRIVGLDLATGLPRLASGGGAQWSESTIQLLGTVRSG